MATKAKELPHHRREKSSSAPSTPRSISFPHSRRESTTDADELLPLPRRPIPNYRKPTISSAHETNCPSATKQHRIFIKKNRSSIDKHLPTSPTSLVHKVPRLSNKEKSTTDTSEVNPSLKCEVNPNTKSQRKSQHSFHLQPSATFPRTAHTKSATPSKVNIKVTPVVKPAKSTVKEKVKKGADHEHSHKHAVGLDDGGSDDHYEGSGESMAGESPATARKEKHYLVAEPRRVKVRQGVEEEEVENKGVKLMKHEGKARKESPPASNQVIEETASKLVAKRRNKVAALVGAFETVISQQELEPEPEPEPSQPQLEEGEMKNEGEAAEVAVVTEENDRVTEMVLDKEDETISRDNAAVIVEETKADKSVEDVAVVAAEDGSSSVAMEVTESSVLMTRTICRPEAATKTHGF